MASNLHDNTWGERLSTAVAGVERAPAIPPKFREFFKQRNGCAWPRIGDLPTVGTDWPTLIFETQADYLDLIAARVFGESLEGAG